MNPEEAKLILSSIHHDAAQEDDSEVLKALDCLEHDPELQAWFEQERAFDQVISAKLAEIEPPANLKASLIKLLGETTPPPRSNISWFRSPLFAAAAAIIVLPLIAIQLFTGRAQANDFGKFRNDMVQFATSKFELDHHADELPKIYQWLNDNDATCPTEIPTCIGCPKSVGCKILDWNDENVTLICLRNHTQEVVHCFVIPRKEFANLPSEDLIRATLTLDQLETCGWTDNDNLYLLVGSKEGVKVSAPKSQH